MFLFFLLVNTEKVHVPLGRREGEGRNLFELNTIFREKSGSEIFTWETNGL